MQRIVGVSEEGRASRFILWAVPRRQIQISKFRTGVWSEWLLGGWEKGGWIEWW